MNWFWALILAQATQPTTKNPENAAKIVIWAIILILLVLVGGVVIMLAKRYSSQRQAEMVGTVYTLHELRSMLKNGKISQEEYDKLKEIVTVQTRKTGKVDRQAENDS